MRKFETITIKNPKNGKNMSFTLKDNIVDKIVCSCNGKYTKASDCNAFVFDEKNRTLKCPECGKELEIIQTPAEKEEKEKEFAKEKAKRKELSDRMKEIQSKINDEFISCNNGRMLSDAEANKYYFNPDFGKCNVVTYTVTDTEIIQCRDMGDFISGIAIPYAENVENLIKEFYKLNDEFWGE